jgi:hypothetical protein
MTFNRQAQGSFIIHLLNRSSSTPTVAGKGRPSSGLSIPDSRPFKVSSSVRSVSVPPHAARIAERLSSGCLVRGLPKQNSRPYTLERK